MKMQLMDLVQNYEKLRKIVYSVVESVTGEKSNVKANIHVVENCELLVNSFYILFVTRHLLERNLIILS